MLIPVESNPQLARDSETNVILNVDRVSYRSFIQQKKRRASREQDLQSKLNTLQSQYEELNKKLELFMQQTQGNSQ